MGNQDRDLADHVAYQHRRTRRASRIVALTLFVLGILITLAIAIFMDSGDTGGGVVPTTTAVPATTSNPSPDDSSDPATGESAVRSPDTSLDGPATPLSAAVILD